MAQGEKVYYPQLSLPVPHLPSSPRRPTQRRRPKSRHPLAGSTLPIAYSQASEPTPSRVHPVADPTRSSATLNYHIHQPHSRDILAIPFYSTMATASAQPIALPSTSQHEDYQMNFGSLTGQNGSFTPASLRRFMGSPISFRAGSFGSRFYPGVSPGQLLGPIE